MSDLSGMRSRARGALLGLAVGDALGAAVEFKAPGSFPPVTDYRGGGPHGIPAGSWTDDTSMALALAAALRGGEWCLDKQMTEYLRWRNQGVYSITGRCFDIGVTTSNALMSAQLGIPTQDCGGPNPANGCIMRIAPVAIFACCEDYPEQMRLGAESAMITHAHPDCKAASAWMVHVLGLLIRYGFRPEMWRASANAGTGYRAWERFQGVSEELQMLWAERQWAEPSYQPVARGGVVATLGAALWAVEGASSFSEAVLRAVNLGNDADTVGAVAGQFAGARWGDRGPSSVEPWLDGLQGKEWLDRALLDLRVDP